MSVNRQASPVFCIDIYSTFTFTFRVEIPRKKLTYIQRSKLTSRPTFTVQYAQYGVHTQTNDHISALAKATHLSLSISHLITAKGLMSSNCPEESPCLKGIVQSQSAHYPMLTEQFACPHQLALVAVSLFNLRCIKFGRSQS